MKRRLESEISSDCLPDKGGLNSIIVIALWAISRHLDRMYNRTLASAYTVVRPLCGANRVLLNIDKPHRTSTLHADDCAHIPRPVGTSFKPLDQSELGRDGGWFTVASESEARTIAEGKFPRGDVVRCQYC